MTTPEDDERFRETPPETPQEAAQKTVRLLDEIRDEIRYQTNTFMVAIAALVLFLILVIAFGFFDWVAN